MTEITYKYLAREGFHDFKSSSCFTRFLQKDEHTFYLATFKCEGHHKGEGKQLLLYALKWIANNYTDTIRISLFADPSTKFLSNMSFKDWEEKKRENQLKLNAYYSKLGFVEEVKNKNNFIVDLQTLITTIQDQQADKINKRHIKKKSKTLKKIRKSKNSNS